MTASLTIQALRIAAILSVAAIAAFGTSVSVAQRGGTRIDAISRPAATRTFTSRSGAYTLRLSNHDGWRSATVVGELSRIGKTGPQPVWRKELSQPYGPRFAYISDAGAVVLVDEWRNIPSQFALMAIDPAGHLTAQYTFDKIVEALGVPRRSLSDHARVGIWMTEVPLFSSGQKSMRFKTGGRTMDLTLASGQLLVVE